MQGALLLSYIPSLWFSGSHYSSGSELAM
jgi:hypothetical protein